MSAPEGYFTVIHGNTSINVPRRLFQGEKAVLNEAEAGRFYAIVRGRYPWISEASYENLLKTARKEYLALMDEETGGIMTSRLMADSGNIKGAIRNLETHLKDDPCDADAWMELGKLLCRAGDT